MRDSQEDHQQPHDIVTIENGQMGRVVYARIAPNEDLVQAVEKVCLAEGLRNAFVRGGLGSLVDAALGTMDGGCRSIPGPAVEIVSVAGEVRSDAEGTPIATLAGIVADREGRIHGGPFIAGRNLVCMTFEITLEEWLPDIA